MSAAPSTAPLRSRPLPGCVRCGHAADLHGDRAVSTCTVRVGGYGSGAAYRVGPCPCPGYGVPAHWPAGED